MRELGVDDRWFAPRQVAASEYLAATIAYITVHQRWPRERARASGLAVGRWLRELRRRAQLSAVNDRDAAAIRVLLAVAEATGLPPDQLGRSAVAPDRAR